MEPLAKLQEIRNLMKATKRLDNENYREHVNAIASEANRFGNSLVRTKRIGVTKLLLTALQLRSLVFYNDEGRDKISKDKKNILSIIGSLKLADEDDSDMWLKSVFNTRIKSIELAYNIQRQQIKDNKLSKQLLDVTKMLQGPSTQMQLDSKEMADIFGAGATLESPRCAIFLEQTEDPKSIAVNTALHLLDFGTLVQSDETTQGCSARFRVFHCRRRFQ